MLIALIGGIGFALTVLAISQLALAIDLQRDIDVDLRGPIPFQARVEKTVDVALTQQLAANVRLDAGPGADSARADPRDG